MKKIITVIIVVLTAMVALNTLVAKVDIVVTPVTENTVANTSDTIVCNVEDGLVIKEYPNPFTECIFINSTNEGMYIVETLTGERILVDEVGKGITTVNFDNNIPDGTYKLSINVNGKVYTHNIVKKTSK